MVLYLVILARFRSESRVGQIVGATRRSAAPWSSGVIIIVAITFGTAPQVARIVRGLVLDLKTRDYIAAAEVRGEKPALHHAGRAAAQCARAADRRCLPAGSAMSPSPSPLLGFLGLGLPPPDPDWGKMISEVRGFGAIGGQCHAVARRMAISSLVLGLNLLADGLREISLQGLTHEHRQP